MAGDIQENANHENIPNIIAKFGLEYKACKSYRKVWRIETNAGFKYLKKSKLTREEIWFIDEAQEHLYRRSFTNIPRLVSSKLGEPFVSENDGLYVATDWYFGKELDFGILMDLKQASRFLAEFHLKSAGFQPSHTNKERTCWLNWPHKLEQRLEQLQEFKRLANREKEISAFSRLYLRNFEPFYRQAVSSHQALLNSSYSEVAQTAFRNFSFCHHDYSGRNLMRTYFNRLVLVDFDYCLLDLRIHDLINLMVRNLKHNDWRQELSDFILSEYQAISKLTPQEFEVMYILLCWPQEFWQVGLQYYREKLPWPKERFIKKLRHKIEYRAARNKFLADFQKRHGLNLAMKEFI
jgi:CotS family spore coat protein